HLEQVLACVRLLAHQFANTVAKGQQLLDRGGVNDANTGVVAAVAASAKVGDVHRGQVGVGNDQQGVIRGANARAAQANHLHHADLVVADLDVFPHDKGSIRDQGERAEQILQGVK